MINSRDVLIGLYASWRLFLFDRTAVQIVDGSIGGFWKSFYAAAVALPGAFILRLLFVQNNPDLLADTDTVRITLVFALDYAYQWLVFPLVMVAVAEIIGRERQYLAFIAARNWSQVLQIAIVLPAAVIFISAGGKESGFGPLLLVAAHIVTWIYAWFIARTVLDITGLAAALIVFAELAISVLISFISELLIAAG